MVSGVLTAAAAALALLPAATPHSRPRLRHISLVRDC